MPSATARADEASARTACRGGMGRMEPRPGNGSQQYIETAKPAAAKPASVRAFGQGGAAVAPANSCEQEHGRGVQGVDLPADREDGGLWRGRGQRALGQ